MILPTPASRTTPAPNAAQTAATAGSTTTTEHVIDAGARPPVPAGLRCKLSQRLLEDDAVLAGDGYTYSKSAWDTYTRAHPHALKSPVTHQPVSAAVVPSRHIKTVAAEWRAWHDASPAPTLPFDMVKWVKDFDWEVMRQPVLLPDGVICDLETARSMIFNNTVHPGRSWVNREVTFDASQKLLRDLNTLELAEEAMGVPKGAWPRTYVVPSIASMLPRSPQALGATLGTDLPQEGPRALAHHALEQSVAPARRQTQHVIRDERYGTHALLVGVGFGVALAPLVTGVAAYLGAFDGVMEDKKARMMSVILCVGTLPWVMGLACLAVCLGRRPRVAAAGDVTV